MTVFLNGPSLARKGKRSASPGVQAALKDVDLKTQTAQQGTCHARAAAVFVDQKHGLFLVDLFKFMMNAIGRDIDRVSDAFLLEILGIAQIDDLGALVVDQFGGRAVVDFGPVAALGDIRRSKRQGAHQNDGQQQDIVNQKLRHVFVSNLGKGKRLPQEFLLESISAL